MDSQQVFTFGQQSLYMLLMISAPILLTVLAVGLVVSIFQAATQIHEATLSFVPKILASGEPGWVVNTAFLDRGEGHRLEPVADHADCLTREELCELLQRTLQSIPTVVG